MDILIRELDENLVKKIEDLAEREHRNRTQQIIVILEQYFENVK